MTQKIIRVDGIEYERKKKNVKYTGNLNIRYEKEKIEQLKEIAQKKEVKYNQLIRMILDEYIELVVD